ncbi:uncharacterized protein [Salminus brasiliensis]
MWRLWILLCTASLAESQKTDYVELPFGHQLSIKLSLTRSDSLEFTSVDESQHYTVKSSFVTSKRGTVTGSGDSRRFIISSVNFDDEGTYIQKNFWNKVTSITKVKVLHKRGTRDCVPGETLSIWLDGIRKDEASLRFSNEDVNLMLVERGSPVKNLPDYFGRIKVTSSSIQVLNVNVSDVGNYTLFDGQDRRAVTIRMYLVDHHEGIDASPLMALLLLLGIPAGVCCCCRKKIFRKSSQSTAMTTIHSQNMISPPGPPPAYNHPVAPVGPGPIYTPGYPAPGESQVHPPPPNPGYPVQPQYGREPAMPQNPQGPASGYPPAQPTQWTGPPYNPAAPAMYTPGYPTPGESQVHPPPLDPAYPPQPYSGQPAMPFNPGFTPVMYSAPAGSETEGNKLKMNEMSAATPLLTPSQTEVGPPPAPYTATDVLNSSNSTVQFNVDTGKSSTYNFL